MPATQQPPAARGGRRGKHREKRLKMLEAKPPWLATNAPYGKYLVDTVAMELFLRGLRGAAVSGRKVVRLVRENVSVAAHFAAMRAKIHLRWRPEKSHLTNSFFEDLHHIQSRIRRNEGLTSSDLQTSLRISIPRVSAETLLSSLRLVDIAIRDYLESYRLSSGECGNYDWQTRCFIDELFELWCRCVRVDLYDERQVFNKLLAAAWRDVGFPTEEQDGRCLEEWLADRVRKHFVDGVCNARRERQELNIWLDKFRARVPGPPKSRAPGPPKLPLGAYLPLGLAGASHKSPGGA
jgi:hypothetical protein